MKKILFFAATAAFLAACSSDDLSVQEQPQQVQAEPGAVGFDAYLQKTTTRGGYASADMNLTQLQAAPAAGGGFGVFGYYTNNHDYDQTALPNFMYNQLVEWDGSATPEVWKYSPVMYWPNEYGYNAESDDFDKVTFFAYAPYVEVTAATGKLASDDEWGIVGMTRNSNAGDPILKYIASFDNKYAVDVLWGVCQQNDWTKVQAGDVQDFTIGKPWLDVQRPGDVDQKLKFTFKHATAKLTVKVDEFNDTYTASTSVHGSTRIWIRSVRFTGFTMKGALNLNNEEAGKPYWLNFSGLGDLVADGDVIVYDGQKDGKEGTNGGIATNEKVLGLNEKFVETDACYDYTNAAWKATPTGVDENATSLFKSTGSGSHFYVIPTDDDMEVEIVYDVETIDPNLYTTLSDGKTKGSHIENKISKKIKFGSDITKLEAGKAYVINLHLGMNDVDFDADIVNWDDMPEPDIDLPANMPAYAAKTDDGKLEIPGATTSTVFAITGFKGGEAIASVTSVVPGATIADNIYYNSTSTFPGTAAACDKRANASGVLYVMLKGITANETIKDLDAVAVEVVGTQTTTPTTISVVQKAEPLALSRMTTTDNKTYIIQVKRGGSDKNLGGYITGVSKPDPANDEIRVWYDGAELDVVTNAVDVDGTPAKEKNVQLTWNPAGTTATLTFNTTRDAVNVKHIKLYLKAGDVPAETITVKSTDGSNIVTP